MFYKILYVRMEKTLKCFLLVLIANSLLSLSSASANGSMCSSSRMGVGASKQAKAPESKRETAKTNYDKLFSKPHDVAKGLLTLKKVDGKVYCEFPQEFLGKDFGIASTVVKTSENGHSIVGEKPHPLKYVRFEMIDSVIFMTDADYSLKFKEGDEVEEAYRKTMHAPLEERFDIKAKTPDGKAYVIDMTDLFITDRSDMNPFSGMSFLTNGGFVKRNVQFAKNRSLITGIKAFSDNVVIESTMSYGVNMSFMSMPIAVNKPYTAVMSRSLFLLPEEKMEERIADPRINFFTTHKKSYQDGRGTGTYSFAHRWSLEPKDKEAYLRGELVEPKKPIKFYIDNKFPDWWKPYVKEGIEIWNIAFERAGFKNAIVTEEFPEGDSTFYIGDMNYSCVHYAPSPNTNSAGPSWVDPRTGEIINASIYLYHDIIKLLQDWRFIQTAQLDPRIREQFLSRELMGEGIQYVISHEMGHCLGLMHNMAASAAFPVDSLRSISFTQKYGTTPSIMDYARFNYIAQPGDKGVKLTPPLLGEYDMYAIEWGYRYYGEADPERDLKILSKVISDKAGDAIYRHGKQQVQVTYDPSSQTEDLGDDPVKAAGYGIENLKYILSQMDGWFEDFDYDYTYTEERYKSLTKQYLNYMRHVFDMLGGVYLTEKYRGDDVKIYEPVPREKQREALHFFMKEYMEMGWLTDIELIRNLPLSTPFDLNMQSILFRTVLKKDEAIAYSAYLSEEEEPYTPEDLYDDLIAIVFGNTKQGKSLSKAEMDAQILMVETLAKGLAVKSGLSVSSKGNSKSFQEEVNYMQQLSSLEDISNYLASIDPYMNLYNPVAGFAPQKGIMIGSLRNIDHIRYDAIMEIEKIVKKKQNTGNENTRSHYRYLLNIIQ